MKVLIYTLYLPELVDGASTSARKLVKYFKKHGIDAEVCTTDLGWNKEKLLRCSDCKVFPALFSHPLEISPKVIFYLLKNISKYDVVHFRGIFSVGTVIGTLLAKILSKPSVISPLGNLSPTWKERKSASRGFAKFLFFELFCKLSIQLSDLIICASQVLMSGTG